MARVKVFKNATKGLVSELGDLNSTNAPLEGLELESEVVKMKESDPLTTSAILRRMLFILATNWEIIGDDGQQKQFILDMSKNWNIEITLKDILERRFYGGHTLVEKIWSKDGASWTLEGLRSIPYERYEIEEKEELVRLLPEGQPAEPIKDDLKFVLWTFGGPGMYGHGFLRKFYRMSKTIEMYLYKIEPQLFWRYAAAFLHAKLSDEDDKGKFRDEIDKLINNPDLFNGITTGPESEMAWTQFSNHAVEHMIKSLQLKKDILEVYILGQTLTASVGASGSRAAAEVHESVLFKLLESDYREIEVFMNNVIKQVLSLNFQAIDSTIEFSYIVPEKVELPEVRELLPILLKHGDNNISRSGIHELYRIPEAESEDDALTAGESLAQTFLNGVEEGQMVDDEEAPPEPEGVAEDQEN